MKRKIYTIIALILVLSFGIALAGCGGGSTNAPAPSGGGGSGGGGSSGGGSAGGGAETNVPTGNPVRPNNDDYELLDLTYLEKEWDLDPDVLGRFQLNFTTHEPMDSVKNRFCREWADAIYVASRGGVEIVNFPSQTLVTSADALAATQLGTADLAWLIGSNFPQQFPILCMTNLAVLGLDVPTAAAQVLWDLLDESEAFRNEIFNRDTRMLLMYSTGATGVHTNTVQPVRTLEDFQGLKLRVLPGTPVDLVTLFGASPIAMPPPDMYDALQKGVIDGYAIDWSGIASFGVHEVTNWYSTHGLFQNPMMIIMNQNAWDRLPPEYQEVINYYSGINTSLQHAWMWEFEVYEASQAFSTPDQHITFSDAEWAKIQEIARDYNYNKAASLNIPGFDAVAYLDRIYELSDQYSGDGWRYYQRYW